MAGCAIGSLVSPLVVAMVKSSLLVVMFSVATRSGKLPK